jgi:hypothetical protein
LPVDWLSQVDDVARNVAKAAILEGGTPTSLEPSGTIIRYRLLDGVGVCNHLPWLTDLYRTDFREIAKRISGADLELDRSVVSSVNLNVLSPGEDGYEWHVDSNPVTGLLFLSSHLHQDGGILELKSANDHLLTIEPLAGTLAVFDARLCPHRVSPPKKALRISAPMNYFIEGQRAKRPEELDSRLYGAHTIS